VKVTPFFDLVLAWHIGISLSGLQNDSRWPRRRRMGGKVLVGGRSRDLDGNGPRTVMGDIALRDSSLEARSDGIDRLGLWRGGFDFALFHLQYRENYLHWYGV